MYKSIKFNVERAGISTQSLHGTEHIVLPLIALVEQVIFSANADEPNLVLAEEFSKVPAGWNGRPVVINHPVVNGEHVSADSSEVLETEKIGEIFNTMVEDEKLKMEAWINLATVESKDDFIKDIIDNVQNGEEIIEISTGLFADVEPAEGEFNGKEYKGIWRNIVPDHLAILSESKGACSIEDGCGIPRINHGKDCSCGGSCDACKAQVEDFHHNLESEETLKSRFSKGIKDQRKKLSDVDRRQKISRALTDNVSDFWFIEAIFNKSVVYFAFDDKFWEQTYKIESDGSVTFEGNREEVMPETRFVKVTSNRSNDIMDKETFVQALIDNAATKFTSEDKDWLLDQEEETLAKMEPVPAEPEAAAPAGDPPSETPAVEANAENPTPATVEEFLNSAPAAVRETLTHGMQLVNAQREVLTTKIMGNANNKFTSEQLGSKDLDELDAIASLLGNDTAEDYTGRGGNRSTPIVDNNAPPPMPAVFPKKPPRKE